MVQVNVARARLKSFPIVLRHRFNRVNRDKRRTICTRIAAVGEIDERSESNERDLRLTGRWATVYAALAHFAVA